MEDASRFDWINFQTSSITSAYPCTPKTLWTMSFTCCCRPTAFGFDARKPHWLNLSVLLLLVSRIELTMLSALLWEIHIHLQPTWLDKVKDNSQWTPRRYFSYNKAPDLTVWSIEAVTMYCTTLLMLDCLPQWKSGTCCHPLKGKFHMQSKSLEGGFEVLVCE